MQKIILSLTLCFLLFSVVRTDPKPAPLPLKFTQGWTTSYQGQNYATGKIFYDTEAKSERINIIDGSDQPICGFVEGIHECSFMTTNQNAYIIAPQIKKCCFDSTDYDITPREIFEDFTSAGQQTLDGISYEKWIYGFDFFDADFRIILLNDKVRPGVMRRLGLTEQDDENDAGWFEFWPNSYTDKFSSKVAFEVPKYCVNFDQCDLDMKEALRKTMKKYFLLNLLKTMIDRRRKTLRQE